MHSLCDIYEVCCSYLKNLYDICRYLTLVVDVEIDVVTFVVEKWKLRVLWHFLRLSSRHPFLWKWNWSINKRQEHSDTSCLASSKVEWNRKWQHFGLHRCFPCPETPLYLWRRYRSINKRQENADTSYLASETGSDNTLGVTVVIGIGRNPFLLNLTTLPFGGSAPRNTAFMPTCRLLDAPLSLRKEWPILEGRGIGCGLTEFCGLRCTL